MSLTAKTKMVQIELDLPCEVIEFIESTAKMSNTKFDVVVNVLLAMAIQSRKVAMTALETERAAHKTVKGEKK